MKSRFLSEIPPLLFSFIFDQLTQPVNSRTHLCRRGKSYQRALSLKVKILRQAESKNGAPEEK